MKETPGTITVDKSTEFTVEQLKHLLDLQKTLAQNFPDVVIGTLNRKMQFARLGGNMTEITDLRSDSTNSFVDNFPQLEGDTLPIIKRAFYGEKVVHEAKAGGQYFNIRAIPMTDAYGQVDEILCVFRDITEQKRMEEGLLAALDREKELGDLKSRFVTMASHEFRTPLTAILASTFLLESYSGDDYNKEKVVHANRIKRSVNNLTNILNEFLSLEKLEANKVSVVHSDINVPEYIQDDLISEAHRPQARAHDRGAVVGDDAGAELLAKPFHGREIRCHAGPHARLPPCAAPRCAERRGPRHRRGPRVDLAAHSVPRRLRTG